MNSSNHALASTIRLISKLRFVNSLRFLSQQTVSDNQKSDGNKTHFGFEVVDENEKTEKVHKVFESVASSYDKMNDAMSFGIHRIWKDIFMDRLSPVPGTKLLDVAGGTGDIAFRFLKYLKNDVCYSKPYLESHVTISDINEHMLNVGKSRAEKLGHSESHISWLLANAEELPIEDNSYTAYTIAFGIRNVTHMDKALAEAYRVLKPGGRFLCLEFSQVDYQTLQWIYDRYSFEVIPVMGQVIAGDWKSYEYLVESIRQFPNKENFSKMIRSAGFRCVTYENLTFGVAAIHSGFKL